MPNSTATSQNQVYGWFDSADQRQPTYDPPHDAPCLFCGEALTPLNSRTVSMRRQGDGRSYFYRTHRSCSEAAPEAERLRVDSYVWDLIDGKVA